MRFYGTSPDAAVEKYCPRCQQTLPLSAFGLRNRSAGPRPRSYCRTCTNAYYRAKPRRAEPPLTSRRRRLHQRYWISPEEWDEMAARQGGRCAICGLERRLVIDHDHASGRVRGLLCHPCNIAIGILDRPEQLASALRYLGRPEACR